MSERDDSLTVAAIAVLAMCVATVAHEAAGHGSACLLAGGRIAQLTSVYFQCDGRSRFIAIAGPVGNLVAAVLGWLVIRLLPSQAVRARLLAFAVTALSIYWAAGYLIEAMAINHGDYVFAGEDFLGQPSAWWRASGIVLGVAVYIAASRVLAREAAALSARAAGLLRRVWLASGLAAVAAAAFYAPDRVSGMEQAFLEIAAAAFPLLFIGNRIAGNPDVPPIARSPAWIVAGILAFAAFTATLGRGVF
jgi:hypothetical protein